LYTSCKSTHPAVWSELKFNDRFPETKGRTLEEIGVLFGDKHVATQWYGLSEEERMKIRDEALRSKNEDKGGAIRMEEVAL
jgi:hypothetical protein